MVPVPYTLGGTQLMQSCLLDSRVFSPNWRRPTDLLAAYGGGGGVFLSAGALFHAFIISIFHL